MDPKDQMIEALRARAECAELSRDVLARELRRLFGQLRQQQPEPEAKS